VTLNILITFCLSFSQRTYTMQSLSLLKRFFACTPRTKSPLLRVPPSCSLTASHVRGSSPCQLRLLLPRSLAVYPAPLLPHHNIFHLFPFQIRGRVYRYGAKNLYRKRRYISHRGNTNGVCVPLLEAFVKRFKHGREVLPAAQLQYLKPQLLAQALAHEKFVFTLPNRVRNDPEDLQSWSRRRRVFGTLNVT